MISYKKLALYAAVLMVHISLLNLFFVSHNGPVFLWDENLRWQTLLTHLFTVLLATAILCLLHYVYHHYINKTNEKTP